MSDSKWLKLLKMLKLLMETEINAFNKRSDSTISTRLNGATNV